jgi:glucose dehydrogenase
MLHALPRALSFSSSCRRAVTGAEATPIVADGRLYVTSDFDVVTAFDLRSNRRLWRYAAKLGVAKACCGPVNRGVALALGFVFVGTLDSRLIVGADSGTLRWIVDRDEIESLRTTSDLADVPSK